jgi:hypothetical protein
MLDSPPWLLRKPSLRAMANKQSKDREEWDRLQQAGRDFLREHAEEMFFDDISERIIMDQNSPFLISILCQVFKRLPAEDIEVLCHDRDVRFVMPTFNCVRKRYFPAQPVDREEWLVILRSDMPERSPHEMVYTVAHELAHVFLEHDGRWQGDSRTDCERNRARIEVHADLQVVKWGFENELKSSPYSYLYGSGFDEWPSLDREKLVNELAG